MTDAEKLELEKKKKKKDFIPGPVLVQDKNFDENELAKLKKFRESFIDSVPEDLRKSKDFKETLESLDDVIEKQTIIGKPSTFAQMDELRNLYSDFNEKAVSYITKNSEAIKAASKPSKSGHGGISEENREIIEELKKTDIGKLEINTAADELPVTPSRESNAPADFRPSVLEEIQEAPESEEDDPEELELIENFKNANL